MMAATPTKPWNEAEAGDSKDQHAVILAFCSPIAAITRSARTDGALNPRLAGQTWLNDGIIDDIVTERVSNGKSRVMIKIFREYAPDEIEHQKMADKWHTKRMLWKTIYLAPYRTFYSFIFALCFMVFFNALPLSDIPHLRARWLDY